MSLPIRKRANDATEIGRKPANVRPDDASRVPRSGLQSTFSKEPASSGTSC
jgi:hypothetical protein